MDPHPLKKVVCGFVRSLLSGQIIITETKDADERVVVIKTRKHMLKENVYR